MSISRWTLGGVHIYVTDMNVNGKQTIARLQPLVGGTVKQYFGFENNIIKIKGYVVGDSNIASLQSMVEDGSYFALVEYLTGRGSYNVASFNSSRVPAVYQTLSGNCDDPLYIIDMELFS